MADICDIFICRFGRRRLRAEFVEGFGAYFVSGDLAHFYVFRQRRDGSNHAQYTAAPHIGRGFGGNQPGFVRSDLAGGDEKSARRSAHHRHFIRRGAGGRCDYDFISCARVFDHARRVRRRDGGGGVHLYFGVERGDTPSADHFGGGCGIGVFGLGNIRAHDFLQRPRTWGADVDGRRLVGAELAACGYYPSLRGGRYAARVPWRETSEYFTTGRRYRQGPGTACRVHAALHDRGSGAFGSERGQRGRALGLCRPDRSARRAADDRFGLPIFIAGVRAFGRRRRHGERHFRADRIFSGGASRRYYHGVYRRAVFSLFAEEGIVMAMFEVKDALVRAGKKEIFRVKNLTISGEKRTAIIGPNGSGKSTLLKLLSGSVKTLGGQVLFDGTPIRNFSQKAIAKRLAILPQGASAPADLTVSELVDHGRFPHRNWWGASSANDREQVRRALAQTGIETLADRFVNTLSGGERQRAWIAMALAQQPEALLLDEPTTYLDAAHQLEVMRIVSSLNAEHRMTIVMVLHDLYHAARFADEVIVVKDGEVFATGRPDEVVTASLLAEVFGVAAQVFENRRGDSVLLPVDLIG